MPELRRVGVASIGESARIEGYALAGVAIRAAEDPEAARRAWDALSPSTGVVILTPGADAAIGARRSERLTTVLPA